MLVDAMNAHSMLLIETHPQEAVAETKQAVETARRIFPSPHPKIALSLHQLGAALYYISDYTGALACHEEALEMRRRLFGDEATETLESRAAKGSCLTQLGRHEEAVRHTTETIAIYARRSGGGSYEEAHEHMMLSISLHALHRLPEAIAEQTRALSGFRKFADADDPKTGASAQRLSDLLREANRAEESAAVLRDYTADLRKGAPSNGHAITNAQFMLADLLLGMDTPAASKEAETVLRDCLEARRRLFPDGHPSVRARYMTMALLGSALVRSAKLSNDTAGRLTILREAEPLLLQGYDGLKAHALPGVHSPDRSHQAILDIITLYEMWESADPGKGFATKAAQWRATEAEPYPAAPAPTPASR
jgi:tetratricopeptide (TPR) repeat protein